MNKIMLRSATDRPSAQAKTPKVKLMVSAMLPACATRLQCQGPLLSIPLVVKTHYTHQRLAKNRQTKIIKCRSQVTQGGTRRRNNERKSLIRMLTQEVT